MEDDSEMVGSDRTMAEPAGLPAATWRTRDIVVAAVIGVAFGVVFWAWNLLWNALAPASGVTPLPNFLLYGVWLMPAVLAPLIVRKPGAAVFAEMVAAIVSAFLPGNVWGPDVLLSGLVQGAAAEIIFAMTLYRGWTWPVLALAAIASAAAAWIHDWVVWYPDTATDVQLLRGAVMAVSAVVIVGIGSLLLARALRRAGVLQGFPG
jgi:energy-coupling factor transport system substrate-specific component